MPYFTMKSLYRASAVVYAVWFLVGIATANLVKWSVNTRTFDILRDKMCLYLPMELLHLS